MRFLRWLFSSPAKPAAPAAQGRPASFFTTDTETFPNRSSVVETVNRRALQVTPDSFLVYGQDGVAMDAAGDFSSSAKGAFALADANVPDAQLLWYASQSFIGFQTCAILSQHWLVHKACDVPARDAIRNGYKVTIPAARDDVPPKVVQMVKDADNRMGIKAQCRELVRFSRVFGIRIALFVVDSPDPKYYERPFNPDGVTPGSYRGIVQVDPYWCVPELTMQGASDPTSTTFYDPEYWTIRGRRHHRSHLVIVRGPDVPDILKPSYQYAGISLPQRIYERVYAAERTANEGPQLALSKRAMIFYTDTGKALANQALFEQRLNTWAAFRDNYGIKVADKDGDQIEQHETSLSDFDATVMTQYQLVAAIANVPATKLLGTTPKGFNSSGDYEEASYHEELESIQTNDMSPLIRRHHLLLVRSEIASVLGLRPFELGHEWEPMDTPTAKEEAEVEQLKANRDKLYVECGALDPQDVRTRIIADPKSGYDGLQLAPAVPPDTGVHLPGPPVTAAGQTAPAGGKDAREFVGLDSQDWNPVTGEYAEAQLITNQGYMDPQIVADKIAQGDYTVQLSPEFVTAAGQRYRIVIDGHHSLAAALQAGQCPVFVQADYTGSDYRNVCTQLPMTGQSLPDPANA